MKKSAVLWLELTTVCLTCISYWPTSLCQSELDFKITWSFPNLKSWSMKIFNSLQYWFITWGKVHSSTGWLITLHSCLNPICMSPETVFLVKVGDAPKRVQIRKGLEAFLSLTIVNDKYAVNIESKIHSVLAHLSLTTVNDKYALKLSVIQTQ